jgi:hypothetical protein
MAPPPQPLSFLFLLSVGLTISATMLLGAILWGTIAFEVVSTLL